MLSAGAELYTLFRVETSRSGDVLIDVFGREFAGVLGCDYFSAYRRYMRECGVIVQFCLAHLIRDVKFLTTLPDKAEQAYGQRLRDALRSILFAVIHQRETLNASVFAQQLEEATGAGSGDGLGRRTRAGPGQPEPEEAF